MNGWSRSFARIFMAFALLMVAVPDMTKADENKLVIAHRGASGYLPEHTLAAKAMAYAMGADYVEQDVVLTKDGIPIVLHDIYLETVTDVAQKFAGRARQDGRYYAIDFTLDEIKTLRANERIKRSGEPVFPNRFPQEKSSFQVPTLAEEIELIVGLNRTTGRNVGIFPEIKEPKFHRDAGFDLSKIVIDLLDSYGYRSRDDLMVLQSFDWDETKRIRNELGYKGRLTQLLAENGWGISPETDFDYLKTAEGLRDIATVADAIGPWIGQVVTGSDSDGNPQITDLTSNARLAGLKVYPYTARADALPGWASDFDMLLATVLQTAGADGIFTDFPDKMVRFLQLKR